MSGSLRLVLVLLALVFGGWLVVKVTSAVLGFMISLLVPVLVIAAIGGVGYYAINRKALGGRRRTLL